MNSKICKEKHNIYAEDLKIQSVFPLYGKSQSIQNHIDAIQQSLSKSLPSPLPFSEKESFKEWVHTSLPWIYWKESGPPPNCVSLFFVFKPLLLISPEALLIEIIKYWLLPYEETTILSFKHMSVSFELYPNQPLCMGEAQVLIINKKQSDLLRKNFNLFKKKFFNVLLSGQHAHSLLKHKLFSLNYKMGIIQEILIKLIKRFPEDLDEELFHKLAMMQTLTKPDFCEQRSYAHLTRILVSQTLIVNQLARKLHMSPEKRHMRILYTPARLLFPFGRKSVLGLNIGVNFFHKHEFFEEKHVLLAVKKFVSNSRIVSGSFYRFNLNNGPITIFYVDLEKEGDTAFTLEEKKIFKTYLEEELKKRIENLVPSLFIIRNEEETIRNILMLSREFKFPHDIPQMMITFDQHSQEDLIFTIVLLRIKKKGEAPMQDLLKDPNNRVHFIPDRIQIVSYLEQKYPVEANVFRLQIKKLPAFLRMDFSVNLYLARQKVASFIKDALGGVRDYNGGMMLKQEEVLSQFKHVFRNISSRNQELLENFFYSLNPIEAQATISLHLITLFFQLFLKVVGYECPKKKMYVVDFEQHDAIIIAVMRSNDPEYFAFVKEALNQAHIYSCSLISSVLVFEGNHYLSYVYDQANYKKRIVFQKTIKKALTAWQAKKDKLQTLKLTCSENVCLDPRIGGNQESSLLVKLLFDGLMRIGTDGKPQCSIAKSYFVSEDRKRYTFTIRQSYWSDGSPLIAYDFEYAWKKVLSPNFFTLYAYVYYPIKNARAAKKGKVSIDEVGVKAIDETTLVVDLEQPVPYFIELTANTLYSPVNHMVDKIYPNWAMQKNENFICNGPFLQCSSNGNFAFEFKKNHKYWNVHNIKIDQILFSCVRSKTALNMFKNNQLDFMGLNLTTVDEINRKASKRKASFYSSRNVLWQCFNITQFPFNNYKIRLAFSMAINRREIIRTIPIMEKGHPAFTPLPMQLTQHLNSKYLIPEDEAMAKKHLQEGLKELGMQLNELPVIYLSSTVQDEKMAVMFKAQWERVLGIKCEVKVLHWEEHFTEMITKNHQIGVINWVSWINDPIYTLQAFKYGDEPVNFSGWEDSEFSWLLDLSDQTVDPKLRKHYLADAEKILIENAVLIPVFYGMGWFINNPNLTIPASASNGNLDFSQAYFHA